MNLENPWDNEKTAYNRWKAKELYRRGIYPDEAMLEDRIESDLDDIHVTQWVEEKKEDIYDAMDKVESALNTYNTLARLQALGEDITDGLEVANKAFEEALSNLGKYNISKEELEKYINRRDAIINSNIESKNERTL